MLESLYIAKRKWQQHTIASIVSFTTHRTIRDNILQEILKENY